MPSDHSSNVECQKTKSTGDKQEVSLFTPNLFIPLFFCSLRHFLLTHSSNPPSDGDTETDVRTKPTASAKELSSRAWTCNWHNCQKSNRSLNRPCSNQAEEISHLRAEIQGQEAVLTSTVCEMSTCSPSSPRNSSPTDTDIVHDYANFD